MWCWVRSVGRYTGRRPVPPRRASRPCFPARPAKSDRSSLLLTTALASTLLIGTLIAPGLSLGILLGALVIVMSWVLTWIYVRWANTHYDRELEDLQR